MLKKVPNSVTQQFSSIAEKNLKSCGKDVLDVCQHLHRKHTFLLPKNMNFFKAKA